MRVAVLASGRGSNFDALRRASETPDYPARIALLVSDRANAAALGKARDAGIATAVVDPGTVRGPWTPAGVRALLEALEGARIETICLAGFLRVVPSEVLAAAPGHVLNIHPSLLPAFPGLRAPRQALCAGVKVAGCTVHFVDEGVDTGPIIAQAAVPVLEDDTEETLAARILVQEHRLYPESLRLLAQDRLRVVGRRVDVLHAPHDAGTPGRIR